MRRRFLPLLIALPGALTAMLVWAPGGMPKQSRHYAAALSFQYDEAFFIQQARLGLEKPGVHINLIQTRLVDPAEAGQQLQLVTGKQKIRLTNISQLRGHVAITHEEAALRYVRLFTSPQTWYLLRYKGREMEVLESTTLPEVLAAGFGEQRVLLSAEDGKDNPYWLYDPDKKKFDMVRHTSEDKYITLKTEKYPDLSAYGTGFQGILSRKLFRASGCTLPKITTVKGGYEITRWLFTNSGWVLPESSEKDIYLVREFVGMDGTYKRTVLRKKTLPPLPGVTLLIPTFE